MAGTTDDLKQPSPIFLAPGTGFVEDNFSKDGVGGGWFQDDSTTLLFFFLIGG